MFTATFTIVARCEDTGELGIATSTAIPAGGAICPFVSRNGAISTQSFNNFYFGIDGQRFLAEGLPAGATGEALLRGDPGRDARQLVIVDCKGGSWAFTGSDCVPDRGHRICPGFAIAENMLATERLLDEMASAFVARRGESLSERLISALEAGQRHGGDRRGKQSAAIKVARPDSEIPACDLRVDEHADPVRELRRVYEIAKVQLFPFMRSMPTRTEPSGSLSAALREYLGRDVSDR